MSWKPTGASDSLRWEKKTRTEDPDGDSGALHSAFSANGFQSKRVMTEKIKKKIQDPAVAVRWKIARYSS